MVRPVDDVMTQRLVNAALQKNEHRHHPATDQKAEFNKALTAAATSKHAHQPTRKDLEEDSDGKLEYTVRAGDNWSDIGKRFGRSDEEMDAANSDTVANRNLLHAGQKIVILNDDRAKIAVEMADTKDHEKLKQLITEDLTYATRGLATPADQLKAAQDDLIARRPGDAAFAKLVKGQGEVLQNAWDAQGRSHAVWDPLLEKAEKGDWQGVKTVVGDQLATLAATTPTTDAVKSYQNMLLNLGPKTLSFAQAVDSATEKFLVDDPEKAAKQVADAYKNGGANGALDASKKLRELTDPQKTNPLTAALIVDKAFSTVMDIATDFVNPAKDLSHEDRETGTVGDYGDIYRNISAVVDSIDRSPEGKDSIESIATTFQAHGAPMIDAKGAAADGSGTVLSLAIAKELLWNSDIKNANRITKDVQQGVEDLKKTARDDVSKLGKDANPLLNPTANWDPFLKGANGKPIHSPDMQAWIDKHPGIAKTLKGDMDRLNVDGYHIQRAMAGIDEYAQQLDGVDNKQALIDQTDAPDPQKDRALSLALAVSSAGLQEGLRQFNVEGLEKGELTDLSKIVPDASWSTRMARNNLQQDIKVLTGAAPFNVGLSLFGTGTYLWGVADHGTELHNKVAADGWEKALTADNGWRNLGFLGMYVGGTAIEGGQAMAQIITNRMGLNKTEPGWRGIWAQAATQPKVGQYANMPMWAKGFINHLRAFGWWNAIGTANYALEGNWPKAGALGTATAGTFISSYPGFAARLGLGAGGSIAELIGLGESAGPVVGTALVLLGSAAIYGLNKKEKADIAAETEPFNKDYLIRAGLKPEIADELANNDSDGVSPGPRLLAVANYLNIEPPKLLDWLNKQDVNFVHHFVTDALLPLKADDKGNYVERAGKDEWDVSTRVYDGEVHVYPAPYPKSVSPTDPKVWRDASIFEARSLEGVKVWAQAWGHPLPSATP